jgi:hypothetical protein
MVRTEQHRGSASRIIIAVLAVAQGLLVVFAWGLLAGRDWARTLGLGVAVVHLILAGLALAEGGFIARDLLWVVVPVTVVVYLLRPGHGALGRAPA